MSPEESYNDSDPVSFEPFSEMESKDYIMYRCKKQRDTNGKFRVISCETLLQLALNSPYGYLESVLDPYTREPFVGVEVQVISWKPIWIDLLIRFFIRASQ
jgi:hypothetical protein